MTTATKGMQMSHDLKSTFVYHKKSLIQLFLFKNTTEIASIESIFSVYNFLLTTGD